MKTIFKWIVCFTIAYYTNAPFLACIITNFKYELNTNTNG